MQDKGDIIKTGRTTKRKERRKEPTTDIVIGSGIEKGCPETSGCGLPTDWWTIGKEEESKDKAEMAPLSAEESDNCIGMVELAEKR